jgi:hypothetical protein
VDFTPSYVWPDPVGTDFEVLWDKEGTELVEMLGSWPVKPTTAAIPRVFQILVSWAVLASS